MIVPDAIEPYYGYKWLHVNSYGFLSSHYGNERWPDDSPVVAKCIRNWGEEWRPIPSAQAKPKIVYATHSSSGMSPGFPYKEPAGWVIHPGQEPQPFFGNPEVPSEDVRTSIVLPYGLSWSWEKIECPHELSPDADCTCGVYVVSNKDKCDQYRRSSSVLVKVALWGKVIPGTDGARGQFAYPVNVIQTEGGAALGTLVRNRYFPPPPPKPPPAPAPALQTDEYQFQPVLRPQKNWRDKLGL